jgi:hypothetical protein
MYYHAPESEIKHVCSYLIGKIDNNLISNIDIDDYHIYISNGETNGALIVNFNIKTENQ